MKFINFLKTEQGIDRNFGIFDGQLNLPFKFYSAEGYDTLFPADYGKLLNVDTSSRVSGISIPKNSSSTISLLNLLGIKYVIQGTVHGAASWELQLWNYPDQFDKIYEDERYQVFLNQKVKPRTYLIKGGNVNVKTYTSQKIEIEADSPKNNTLVLSDNYYPGWYATIDNRPTLISRTDSNLRSITLLPGRHLINLVYHPLSFTLGLATSIISLIGLALLKRLA